MKKILIFPLLMLFLGCTDDPIEEAIEENNTSYHAPQKREYGKNADSTTSPKTIDIDSAARFAMLQYNKLKIEEYADQIIESILKKNKKLEFSNAFADVYGYVLSAETKDMLAHYGFKGQDISFDNSKEEIYLTGRKPYIDQGIYEKVDVNIRDVEAKYPHLYIKALEHFYQQGAPKIYAIDVADQSGNTTDYCEKIRYKDDQEQYICFTVQTLNQKTIVTLKRD